MAQKKISDLTLRSDFDATCQLPVDDASQSWRVTGAQIKAFIAPQLVPTGAVLAWAGTAAPTGFLLCNGSAVSRTTYADLFAVIAEYHGQGDNSTTFNLPDYRGRFLRGVAGGESTDPDSASRTAMNTGGNTGDNVGSIQGHAFQGHRHVTTVSDDYSVDAGVNTNAWHNGVGSKTSGDPVTDGTNGTPVTSSETRPVNAYVNYIIKT